MSYHPRIETSEYASFVTTRSRNSELWFVNNPELEDSVLGAAAKYASCYEVALYGLAIEGSHIHTAAQFPNLNRASFMRDFNSSVTRSVKRHCPLYPGGALWGRRYSVEFMPGGEDIEDRFFYTVLQPVQDGLVERISDYPGYNCFHDAVHGVTREYKVVRFAEYNAAKRFNSQVAIRDYTDTYELRYERLPGYEHLSQREYAKLMGAKLEERRQKIVSRRRAKGLGFAGRQAIQRTIPGTRPYKSKESERFSHRPRVLSICPERRRKALNWYFAIYDWFKAASERYRAGDYQVVFPPGTYKPWLAPPAPARA